MRRVSVALLAAALFIAGPGTSRVVAQPLASTPAASASATPLLPRTLPLRREEPAAPPSAVGAASAALLLAALAAGGLLAWRRGPAGLQQWRSRRSGAAALARVSSQALTPHASIHVVHWSDEELLLGCTAQQVTVIARRPLSPAPGADR
ncbi:MAG TPA: flagellar biosynthetic protein FliO [Ramlibacter sp.]|jgi:flagellar biogenesis protein FliO